MAPFQKAPDQRLLNGLKRPDVPVRIGMAVFITSNIEIIFVASLRGSDRGRELKNRKSLLRHPVELNRGTPLAFPMQTQNASSGATKMKAWRPKIPIRIDENVLQVRLHASWLQLANLIGLTTIG